MYVHAGPNLIAEYNAGVGASTPVQEYVYADQIDSLVMIHRSNNQKLGVTRNRQWSVVGLHDLANGNVVERYAYDMTGKRTIYAPNGTTVRTTSSYGNNFGYTSRWHDEESGLMYFRARYYNPLTGEFMSRDPLAFVDGMSLYRGYFAIRYMDPFGTLLFDDNERLKRNLSPDSWALEAMLRLECIQKKKGIDQLLAFPEACSAGLLLFAGSGEVISASCRMARQDCVKTSGDESVPLEQRAAATVLRYSLCSEPMEVLPIQVCLTVGQAGAAGPMLAPLTRFQTVRSVCSNPYVMNGCRGVATYNVCQQIHNGEYNSYDIAVACTSWIPFPVPVTNPRRPRVWSSDNAHVGEVATQLDELMPGCIQACNKHLPMTNGLTREIDIVGDCFTIQVKGKGAQNLRAQVADTTIRLLDPPGPCIGYAPIKIGPHQFKQALEEGVPIARDFDELTKIIKELCPK